MTYSTKKNIKSACIIGSTSEVAISICIELAKTGCIRFHLISRIANDNKELISLLRDSYKAAVTTEELNLETNMNCYLKIASYDLYLITIGYLGDTQIANKNIQESLRIAWINYNGLIPILFEITKSDRVSKPGRLWVFTSVAGDRGKASNYQYGASKAALSVFCEGLLMRCVDKPFCVRVIKAGFISTTMSKDKAPKFLSISPKAVAKKLLKDPNKRGLEYLPWWWEFIMVIVKLLPVNLVSKM